MKKICMFLPIFILSSCGCDNISGKWIQSVPGMPEITQGIELVCGGDAKSINMATLQYDKWARDGNTLTMQGTSIGNGQTIKFSETWTIEKLNKNKLILRQGDYVTTYTRDK